MAQNINGCSNPLRMLVYHFYWVH